MALSRRHNTQIGDDGARTYTRQPHTQAAQKKKNMKSGKRTAIRASRPLSPLSIVLPPACAAVQAGLRHPQARDSSCCVGLARRQVRRVSPRTIPRADGGGAQPETGAARPPATQSAHDAGLLQRMRVSAWIRPRFRCEALRRDSRVVTAPPPCNDSSGPVWKGATCERSFESELAVQLGRASIDYNAPIED